MTIKVRASLVIDGVTLPDAYFDHPNFTGTNVAVNLYAEHNPADGMTDRYALATTAVTKTANTQSVNDSRNPTNQAV
jgi:hypothetical protein